jgi:hypothetical protein
LVIGQLEFLTFLVINHHFLNRNGRLPPMCLARTEIRQELPLVSWRMPV